jgi:hypothetical protein
MTATPNNRIGCANCFAVAMALQTNNFLSDGGKGAQRLSQRERVTSPEITSLARGLGTASVPKQKKGG